MRTSEVMRDCMNDSSGNLQLFVVGRGGQVYTFSFVRNLIYYMMNEKDINNKYQIQL